MSVEEPIAKSKPRGASRKVRAASPYAEGWTRIATDDRLKVQNAWPSLVNLNQTLYLYGGDGGNTLFASATGGTTWEAPGGDWPARNYPGGASFGKRLVIVGGEEHGDTWGVTPPSTQWIPLDKNAGWGPRWGHSVVEFNGKLRLYAGVQDKVPQRDAWPFNGETWGPGNKQAFNGARLHATVAVLDGQVFLLGGESDHGPIAQALVSQDGSLFLRQAVPWEARMSAQAVTIGDTLYLLGGRGVNGTLTDVWAFRNDRGWTKVSAEGPVLAQFAAAAYDDYACVAGGTLDGDDNPTVWAFKSPPLGWSDLGRSDALINYHSCSAGVLEGTIWGWASPMGNLVVRSDDGGRSWTRHDAQLPARDDWGTTVHNGKLYASGGGSAGHRRDSDVWCSADGLNWRDVKKSGGWVNRFRHAMASYDGKLWILAGMDGNDHVLSDVWRSEDDGANWSSVSSGKFDARAWTCAVVFDGRLFLLGGYDGYSAMQNVVWTRDGVNWTPETPQWPARFATTAVVLGKTLYLLGGTSGGDPLNDAWATLDGKTWQPVDSQELHPKLRGFGAVVWKDQIIAFAGDDNVRPSDRTLRFLPPQLAR